MDWTEKARLGAVALAVVTATPGCFDPEITNDDTEGTTSSADGSGTVMTTASTMSNPTTGDEPTTTDAGTTADPDDGTTASVDGATTAEEDGTTMVETTVTTGDSGPEVACEDKGWLCIGPPGAGWSDPFARADDAQNCEGQFRNEGPEWYADVTADPGSCDCTCGDPMGTCGNALRANHFQQGCTDANVATNAWNLGVCLFDGPYNPQVINGRSAIAANVANESCDGTITAVLPEPQPLGVVVGCGLTDES
ncbi:MAG: hypothetical protein AAF721_36965, partial [Myxococcota bacterium]